MAHTISDLPKVARSPWYQDPNKVRHHFYGVFEGGGAKGIAYAGALLAMRERKCWFSAVAGSSAGAITAALIAAGLEPEEIAIATEEAVKTVRSGFWSGLANLRAAGGFFDSEKLRGWLDKIFRDRVGPRLGKALDAPVTFNELFDATQIELNVVAADISIKRQLVLSHLSAGNCLVADAVVASCSIPFAFPSRVLAVPEPRTGSQVFHHTVVDGGVWANFPIFVFEDTEFRKFDKRSVQVDQNKVIGFLLKDTNEGADESRQPRGDDIGFMTHTSSRDFRAREWLMKPASTARLKQGLWSSVASWILLPIELLGRIHTFGGERGLDAGRWPTPQADWARRLVRASDGFLAAIGAPGGGLIPSLIPIVVICMLGVGAWKVCASATTGFRDFQSLNWQDIDTYMNLLIRALLTLMVYSVATLTVFVGALGIVTTFLLLRPARRILYSLIMTYITGPGAPEWYYNRNNIVALPIPMELTTLRFDISEDLRRQVIEDARATTLKRLEDILNRRRAH
jgi:predicted acylesterase/phospholipase RssA